MRLFLIIFTAFMLHGCAYLPNMFQTVEDIADDTAIKIEISREAIQTNSDITISIDVKPIKKD